MLVTFGLPISVQFFWIHVLYAKVYDFNANLFLFVFRCADNIRDWVLIGCLWFIYNDSVCAMRGLGEEGGGMLIGGGGGVARLCMPNYSSAQSIVPSQSPILSPSLYTVPVGE